MRPNKDYWKYAGNADYGLRRLFADVKKYTNPHRPVESHSNIINRDGVSKHVTDDVNPHFSDTMGKAPTYITNYYPPQNQIYRTMGLWQTLFLILFMTFIAVFTFYLVTEPSVLVDVWQRVVEFFHSV